MSTLWKKPSPSPAAAGPSQCPADPAGETALPAAGPAGGRPRGQGHLNGPDRSELPHRSMRRASDQIHHVFSTHGVPRFFSIPEKALIRLFMRFGRFIPRSRCLGSPPRCEPTVRHVIIPGERPALAAYLDERRPGRLPRQRQSSRGGGPRNAEALTHMATYLSDLRIRTSRALPSRSPPSAPRSIPCLSSRPPAASASASQSFIGRPPPRSTPARMEAVSRNPSPSTWRPTGTCP